MLDSRSSLVSLSNKFRYMVEKPCRMVEHSFHSETDGSHVRAIIETRPHRRVQECLDVAYGEPTIARTRGSGACLDVVDDGLCIWFRGKGRPMRVVPSTFLEIHRDGENWDQTLLEISEVLACSSLSTYIRGIDCLRSDERGVEGLPPHDARRHTYLIRLLQRGKTSGCTFGVVMIFVRMMDECKTSEGTLSWRRAMIRCSQSSSRHVA